MTSLERNPVSACQTSQRRVPWLAPLLVEPEGKLETGSGQKHLSPALFSPDMEACFRLRHAYFVQERAWVRNDDETPGLERDNYDPHALHLGVWQGEHLAAYLRVLPFDPAVGFMLDRELAAVLSYEQRQVMPREGAVELSRLVCRSGYAKADEPGRAVASEPHPLELLLRQLYQVSLQCGFMRFYIVIETSWLRPFERRFGLPFRVMGEPYRFPDGTQTVAATATLEELEAGMRRHSEAKFRWYRDEDPDEKPAGDGFNGDG